MHPPRINRAIAVVAVLVVASCGQPDAPVVTQNVSALISDQAHNNGSTGFFFLPPLVRQPSGSIGTLDTTASPTVSIEEIDPATQTVVRTVATFTRQSGVGLEVVRVLPVVGYFVFWRTDASSLNPALTYRIKVSGCRSDVLGYADVDLVARIAELRTVDSKNFIGVVKGEILPIRFWIQRFDGDEDGITDCSDNCVTVANESQLDSDSDGIGDACECLDVVCQQGDQCHEAGVCDPQTGSCSNAAKIDGATCSDGDACTEADLCQAGVCVSGSALSCQAADQCHTAGVCDPSSGACSSPPAPDGQICSNPASPAAPASCQAGACSLDFGAALTPASLIVSPVTTSQAAIELSIPFGGDVDLTLSAADLPAGVTVTFNPSTVHVSGGLPVAVAATIAADATVAAGSSATTIRVVGGGHSRDLPLTIDVPACASQSHQRETISIEVSVVDDPVRTGPGGVWTFGKLMRRLSQSDADARTLIRSMFLTWNTPQVVNGFTVLPRGVRDGDNLIASWPKKNGDLDLDRSPMDLLAIVNRMDLRSLAQGHAGEGRLVFQLNDRISGFPPVTGLPFFFILEYRLPAHTEQEVRAWAARWRNLGSFTLPSEAHNAALQAITDAFTADPANLVDLRTNESLLFRGNDWELRQFVLGTDGRFVPTIVPLTPDQSFFNTPALANYINANEAQILGHTHVVPELFNGAPFLGGRGLNPFIVDPGAGRFGMFWKAPGINNNDARHLFSLNTCSGCHGSETGTAFTHLSNRRAGTPSRLSTYLGGTVQITDPVSGVPRTFQEGARRGNELRRFFCAPTGPDTFSVGEGSQRAF